jgi:hypothetical protein
MSSKKSREYDKLKKAFLRDSVEGKANDFFSGLESYRNLTMYRSRPQQQRLLSIAYKVRYAAVVFIAGAILALSVTPFAYGRYIDRKYSAMLFNEITAEQDILEHVFNPVMDSDLFVDTYMETGMSDLLEF